MTTNYKKRKGRIITKFASVKTKKTICVRSALVKNFLYLIEFTSEVVAYQESHHKVFYEQDGVYKPFYFDFLIEFEDRKQLAVVCPQNKIFQNNIINKIANACAANNFQFKVYSEEELTCQPYLENLKLLYKYNRLTVLPNHYIALYQFFKNRSAVILEDLQQYFAANNLQPEIIYTLLFHKFIVTDLTRKPLSPNSVVRPAYAVKEVL